MKRLLPIFFVITVATLSVRAFFSGGFIPTHDGEYHIVRLWQFDKNIQDGELFPIWAPDLNTGYGVPVFEFFYPLPSYIGELFHMIGFDFITSTKLVLAFGLIVSSITFYLWTRSYFSRLASVVGSIGYILAPYHIVDVNVRGSVGEVWALALAPLLLYSITRLLIKPYVNRTLLAVTISSVLLLTSHNILGLIFFIFAFFYGVLICFFEKKNYKSLIIAFVSSLLGSSFFWIPLVFESKYVTGLDIINYHEHFPALFQLIFPSWGTGFSIAGISDQLSFQVGLVHISATFTATYLAFKQRKFVILILCILFFVVVFMTLEHSDFIWRILYPLRFIQFPWRLLSLIVVLSSFMIAYVSQQNKRVAFLFLFLEILIYWTYTNPVVYASREDNVYINNSEWANGTTTWGNTFNIQGFTAKNLDQEFQIQKGEGAIESFQRKATSSKATIAMETDGVILVKRADFPDWSIYVDSIQIEKKSNEDHILEFPLSSGEHSVVIKFQQSTVRQISFLLSWLYLLFLLMLSFHNNIRKIIPGSKISLDRHDKY